MKPCKTDKFCKVLVKYIISKFFQEEKSKYGGNMNIEDIKQKVNNNKIRWTNHVMIRLIQRNIEQEDVINVLLNGEIIEEYDDDYPYQSCLIYGHTLDKKVLHVVCGIGEDDVWIITSYYPNTTVFENDLKVRKEKK